MCETIHDRHTPLAEQVEQLVHNISTWRDAADVIAKHPQANNEARAWLLGVSSSLEDTRAVALRAYGEVSATPTAANVKPQSTGSFLRSRPIRDNPQA